jgi:hypothetical protein
LSRFALVVAVALVEKPLHKYRCFRAQAGRCLGFRINDNFLKRLDLVTLMLERGSVIRPGNWGRMVRAIGSGHPEWQREVILEEVRKVEFPNVPSRFECAFVIDDLPEAQYYVSKASPISLVYQVTLVDQGAPSHVSDWKGTGPYDHTKEWARRYWRGDVMPHPETHLKLRERLTLSRLRVDAQIP